MKKLKQRLFLIIVVIATISCNTEEKQRQKEEEIQKEKREKEVSILKDKYSAIELSERVLNSNYSFEIEKQMVGKTLIGIGRVSDIEKIDNNIYLLKLSLGDTYFHEYYCELSATKEQVDKIISARNQMKHYYGDNNPNSLWSEAVGNGFSIEYAFIFEPTHIKSRLYFSTHLDDYNIMGENIESAELVDYNIVIEVDSGPYIVSGICKDLTKLN